MMIIVGHCPKDSHEFGERSALAECIWKSAEAVEVNQHVWRDCLVCAVRSCSVSFSGKPQTPAVSRLNRWAGEAEARGLQEWYYKAKDRGSGEATSRSEAPPDWDCGSELQKHVWDEHDDSKGEGESEFHQCQRCQGQAIWEAAWRHCKEISMIPINHRYLDRDSTYSLELQILSI